MLLLDAERARLAEVCRQTFGAAAEIVQLREISPGAENYIFELDVHCSGQTHALILKLFALGVDQARKEIELLAKLRAAGFPAATVLHASLDEALLGLPFCFQQRIAGTTLGAAMRAASPQRSEALLRRFAELAARLHALDVRAFDEPKSAGAWLDAELTRYDQALQELEVPEFRPVHDWLLARRQRLVPRGPSLIHQDFHPLNVMIDAEEKLHVLDWTLARVTDPRSDLAQTFQMLTSAGFGQLRQPITQAYEGASGVPLGEMDFFDVFAALKNVAGQFAVLDDGATKRPALWARLGRRPQWERRAEHVRNQAGVTRRTYQAMVDLSGIRVPAAEALFARIEAA